MQPDAAAAPFLRPALRLVLLLGGSLLLWWALATGSAHAENDHASQPTLIGDLADSASSAATHAVEGGRHVSDGATGEVRRTVTDAAATVRGAGDEAPAPVSTVTDTVGTTLDGAAGAVAQVSHQVDRTAAQVVGTVDEQVTASTSTLDAASAPSSEVTDTNGSATAGHRSHRHPRVAATGPDRMVAPHLHHPASVTAAVHAPAATPIGSVEQGLAHTDALLKSDVPLPSTPGSPAPAAPVGSTTAPSVAAVLSGLILAVPFLLRLRAHPAALVLPPAPTLLPGCSPD